MTTPPIPGHCEVNDEEWQLFVGGATFVDELDTLATAIGRFTLEVVAVEVMHVFTLGCNIPPVGFNPT